MTSLVDSLPAMTRILLVFILILLIIKRKWDLGHAFVLGALSLGVVFAMGPLSIAGSALASMRHPKTLSLTIVVSLILVLSHSLEKTGQMARMLEAYKGLVRWPKLNLVVFPALIGLLPMPGGAIFSAPMVKTIGRNPSFEQCHPELYQLLVSSCLGILVAPLPRHPVNHGPGGHRSMASGVFHFADHGFGHRRRLLASEGDGDSLSMMGSAGPWARLSKSWRRF